jgi:hypothetical protein
MLVYGSILFKYIAKNFLNMHENYTFFRITQCSADATTCMHTHPYEHVRKS